MWVVLVALVGLSVAVMGMAGRASCTNCTWTGLYHYEISYVDSRCYTSDGVDHCATYYDPRYVTCRNRDKFKILDCDEGECWQWVSVSTTCYY